MDCSGHHGKHTHARWMPGFQVCRLNNHRETHMRMERQIACCLVAAGEIRRILANPVAHGEGIHQVCGEKYHRPAQTLSSLSPPARLSGYRVARVKVYPSSVGLGAEPGGILSTVDGNT